MKEIILTNKKKGMQTLLICIAIELLSFIGLIYGAYLDEAGESIGMILLIPALILMCVAWLPLIGLRVLKPQEALALTLFGKYIGTIKGEGFYAVNPFCVAVNPAAQTKLNQSGDVNHHKPLPSANAEMHSSIECVLERTS